MLPGDTPQLPSITPPVAPPPAPLPPSPPRIGVMCFHSAILDGLFTPKNCPPGSEKEVYEAYCQFAAIWALGGGFSSETGADFRKMFDSYWRIEYSKAALHDEGSVFDYFIDLNTKKGEPKRVAHWHDIIPEYKHDRAATYQTILVPTMVRLPRAPNPPALPTLATLPHPPLPPPMSPG